MTSSLSWLLVLTALLATGVACNEGRGTLPCEPGLAEPCACPNDADGTRTCGADQTFDACDCPSQVDLPGTFQPPVATRTAGLIEVQIWWVRADGSDEPSTVDLDLHLLHPNGCWQQDPWDCYYSTDVVDWDGDGEIDAELAEDLLDGPGPEVSTIYAPDDTVSYEVAAHFFSAGLGEGPIVPVAQVYVDGQLRAEFLGPTMNDGWWHIARIDGETGRVTPVDGYTLDPPACP